MAKYYVRIKPQFNGIHTVHKENCPFLKDQSKKIYLGEYIDGSDAISEAKKYFSHSTGCVFCTNERLLIRNPRFIEWNMFSYS